MNFFEQQEQARRLSHVLVLLFILTVLLVAALVDAVVLFIALFFDAPSPGATLGAQSGWNWTLIIWSSIGVLLFIGGASLRRTLQLRRGGGSAVALKLGATPIFTDTDNPAWKRLCNVVEEMAIACSTPVPDIYVLENEGGINAFAAGFSASDAAICVTQGCLDNLSRDELQGIIAHEFGHILNGDARLNIRLIGLLHGILVISTIGRLLMASNHRHSDRFVFGNHSRSGSLGVGVALLAIGSLGLFLGRLIQAAVSRSRERLADAAALQFTRQPTGLSGALKKILALPLGSRLQAVNRQEVAHMLFSKGMPDALLASHPPLRQRIRKFDPGFKTTELEQIRKDYYANRSAADRQSDLMNLTLSSSTQVVAMAAAALKQENLSPFESEQSQKPEPTAFKPSVPIPAEVTGVLLAASAKSKVKIDAGTMTKNIAKPNAEQVQAAQSLLEHIPEELAEAARNRNFAGAIIFALIFEGDDETIAKRQLEILKRPDTTAMAKKVQSLHATMATLQPSLHMPLAALAFPGLRHMPKARLRIFIEQLKALVKADNAFSFREYCLVRLIQVQVIQAMHPGAVHDGRQHLKNCTGALRNLLSLVAHFGHDDREQALAAFTKAAKEVAPNGGLHYAPPSRWRNALNNALDTLDRLRPADKEHLIRGLTKAVNHDGIVTVAEAELLRTICAVLHCPLPPVIQPSRASSLVCYF